MSEEQYHSASHCKYLIQYHIIWCPKFRFSVLKGNVEDTLKQILQKICDDYNYHIKALEVMPDHIHIFIDVPQTVAPCDVVRTLKSISAVELFRVFPKLKQFYKELRNVNKESNRGSNDDYFFNLFLPLLFSWNDHIPINSKSGNLFLITFCLLLVFFNRLVYPVHKNPPFFLLIVV